MNENKIIINVDESYKIIKELKNGYIIAPISCEIISDELDYVLRKVSIKYNINDVNLEKQIKISNKIFKQYKTVYSESTVKDRIFNFNLIVL